MNLISFDIEEWYIEYSRAKHLEKCTEYDKYLNLILDKLDECEIKATFFCVGEMGRFFPDVVNDWLIG